MRGDDGDALMASDGQQMLAVAADDQCGSGGHGGRNDVIVIGIVEHHARPAGRHDQADERRVLRYQRRVLRYQRRYAGAEALDALVKVRVAQRSANSSSGTGLL